MDALAKRVAVRPKFFRESFVDDRDRGAARLGRFRDGKITAANKRYSHSGKVIGANAVIARAEGEPVRGRAWLVLLTDVHARALNSARE